MRGATQAKFVVGAIAITLAATACSSSGSSGSSSGNGVVNAIWGTPQKPLTPGNTAEINGSKVVTSILQGLITYDPKTNAVINQNAESVTTNDQQNFTVKLKPGWKFSDGTAVTAKSYVDAWNYTALATNQQTNSSYFSSIKGYDQVAPTKGNPTAQTMSGLKVVDNNTFTVALTAKFSTWPQTLGFLAYDPLPESFFKDPAAWQKNPVGDGPYMIQGGYTAGSNLSLVPNPNYAGTTKPENKGINLIVYTDPTAGYADLLSGKLDVNDVIPTGDIPNMQSDLNGRVINEPTGANTTLSFPLYVGAWNGANGAMLRQGISMAIDRNTIASKILHGSVTPATDWTSPTLGESGGYKSGLCGDACVYNAAKAKQLIDQAGGIPGGSMTIAYNADGGNADWVNAVCNSINTALGNTKACVGAPTATFNDYLNKMSGFQMTGPFRTGWGQDFPLAVDFLQPLYTTGAPNNFSKYSNANFDKLITQGNEAPSTSQANALFQQAQLQLAKDMPVAPLWYSNNLAGYSANVSNVQMDGFKNPVYWAVKK
ncbi:peptide ABC transporter substrate-binding protein [Streptacidiphilus jiangxiensis]|uniref:Peptide/nickel transport system substrate-binding protein/oligopeptide transport system substrate-binding protein n=1 Tax=Streptacidiphilus jiangxiensis TaxID=235985 RepID=A0A1H7FUV0_STRJI|nr:ABC transporter substrate-binding protein [Streptacidiphilus jiangxiensis]SEK27970.1 peptide/nickel transport system substrate-binding protein/oligopeptide transport system substrate-binding protein [Streptacidiphilus jiangxiensis]